MTGYRYTDREFCEAEKRAGLYALPLPGGQVIALMPSGRAIHLPPALAERWRASPLEEPAVIDIWTDDDQLAAERAGCG